MTWLDAVIILVILGFTYAAYGAGLIREVVTLAAVIVGVVVAGQLYDNLAEDVLVFIDNEEGARAISFLVLFGSVFLLGQIAAYVLKRIAALLLLGWADRLGGAAFGFVKGVVVVEALLVLFVTYPQLGLDDAIDDSALGPRFLDWLSFLQGLLPGEFERAVDRFLG